MSECSFCNNDAVMNYDGYFYCKKCKDEEVSFLLMTPKEQKNLVELYGQQLGKYEELISLNKKLKEKEAAEE